MFADHGTEYCSADQCYLHQVQMAESTRGRKERIFPSAPSALVVSELMD